MASTYGSAVYGVAVYGATGGPQTGAFALSGSSDISVSGRTSSAGEMALSGDSALTSSAHATKSGAMSFGGAVALSAAASAEFLGALELEADGALAASGGIATEGALPALVAAARLDVDAARGRHGALLLAGHADGAFSGVRTATSWLAFGAHGDIELSAIAALVGATDLDAIASLAAKGIRHGGRPGYRLASALGHRDEDRAGHGDRRSAGFRL